MKLEAAIIPNKMKHLVAGRTRLWTAQARLWLDVAIWLLSTPLAFLVRFDLELPPESYWVIGLTTLALAGQKLVLSSIQGLHRRSWRRITFYDVAIIVRTVLIVAALSSVVLLLFGPAWGIPRSIAIIDALLTLFLMGGARGMARYWYDQRQREDVEPEARKRVLIIGAGDAGALIVREMLRHPETGLLPVGFLDDDRRKQGLRIASVPVLGTLADLEPVLKNHHIAEVLIAIPSADGKELREVVNQIIETKTGVSYRTIPGLYELISGQVSINRIREVEIEDLLRRPPVPLDSASILGYLEGKTVMVTGAGGSIGSELIRQICRFKPGELILFGHGENSIYALERELDRDWPDIKYRSVIAAIQNNPRLDYIFQAYKPQVIFHTAAHKHVPLMELNPEEAVFNNIIGTKNLVSLALKYGVSHFVNISTDKAVNPTSVMGASKRLVEYIVQGASRQASEDQVFASVRFGNVLGSRGSVIPLFKEQIRAGGPVTITHPDMLRYFMTIPEASQLVLQASAHGRNGEIYILDMGEPVKIVDLAHDLIKLSGLEPNVDIAIEFSGVRPGEKLFEELMTEGERGSATAHSKIFVAKVSPFSLEALACTIQKLQKAALESDHLLIRRHLEDFIEGCNFNYEKVRERVEA